MDFSIELSTTEVPAGAVTFDISNEGPSVHEFVVFKTDLAPDHLPVTSGAVDEEGEGLEPVDEVEDTPRTPPRPWTSTWRPGTTW